LRLSFAGLEPEQIRTGLAVLGKIVAEELGNVSRNVEPSSALV
jgi:DNA-binding transcriptional MocR family regulator